jgi:hypothetical protein
MVAPLLLLPPLLLLLLLLPTLLMPLLVGIDIGSPDPHPPSRAATATTQARP